MHGASLYATLLMTGLLGSLGHCAGMCGPLVLMLNGAPVMGDPPVTAGRRITLQLLYHACRVTIYVLLGAVAGLVGDLVIAGPGLSGVAGWLSLVLGVAVALAGLAYIGLLVGGRTLVPMPWLDRSLRTALRRRGVGAVAALGGLNGLLPCGLVYSALLVAASGGSATSAAAGMALFGLATTPVLIAVGTAGSIIPIPVRERLQLVGGVFIVLVGVQLALRGAAQLGGLSHLHIWHFPLW